MMPSFLSKLVSFDRPRAHTVIAAASVIGSVALGTALAPSVVSAQAAAAASDDVRARARVAYAAGQAAFDAGRFEESRRSFQEAFAAVPNPVVLLGVASAEERLGLRAEARASLERYLCMRPDASDRADVTRRIVSFGGSGTPNCATVLATPAPAPAPAVTAPATPPPAVTAPATPPPAVTAPAVTTPANDGVADAPEDTDAIADAPDEVEEETSAEDTAAGVATPPTESTSHGPSGATIAATTVAGVALIGGTVFGFMALSRQSDFDAAPTASAADEGETFALIADLSFGVAVAAGVTAIVLYATDSSSSSSESSGAQAFRVAPWVGPNGGGAVALGHF